MLNTERRAVARYPAKIALQIDMDEYQLDSESNEVSLHGIKVICDGPVANKLFSKHLQVTPGENIRADIKIKAAKKSGLAKSLKCSTRVISVSRISQNSFIVGFNIIEFDGKDQELWQDYISTKH